MVQTSRAHFPKNCCRGRYTQAISQKHRTLTRSTKTTAIDIQEYAFTYNSGVGLDVLTETK